MAEFKIFENEEEAELAKKKLYEHMQTVLESNSKNFTSFEINWIDNFDCYEIIKRKNLDLISEIGFERLFLIAHSKDSIKGKPQLVHQTIQRIPMIKRVDKQVKDRETGALVTSVKLKFIDDNYDKRYDGNQIDSLAFDFWVYRIIDSGKEYYLFSEKELNQEFSEFHGMKINLDDTSELSTNLKVKKITSIFLVKESNPSIKILDVEKLVEFTKNLKEKYGWDEQGFMDFIFTHPDGKIYDFTPEFNLLRAAQLLSGKYEGYPLHLMKIGPVGTGKTTEEEALDFKFQETSGILEAGTSRIKVLVPSFKEKPANLGYICNCNRIAIIDELMKMIMTISTDSHQNISTYLGELNMLLEQKKRFIGSGNDNSTIVKSTAKVCVSTNPLVGKRNISQHIGMIDLTTLSRFLIWVQSDEECKTVWNKENVRKSPEHIHNPDKVFSFNTYNHISYSKDWLCVRGNDDFLTTFDSCQKLLSVYDEKRVEAQYKLACELSKEPMKTVWKSRGLHHSVLILDGIVKLRCLFKDYDSTLTAIDEDYEKLKKILIAMVQAWDTDFDYTLKNNFGGTL